MRGYQASIDQHQEQRKKARVEDKWSEDSDDMFNMNQLHFKSDSRLTNTGSSGVSLFAGEALLEDDSSSTNDALANNVIYSVEKPGEQKETRGAEVEYVAFENYPPAVAFEAQVRRVIQEHGTVPAGDGRRTIVLDLDETLVHSSVIPIEDADVQFSVDVGDAEFTVYARKRPHCDLFLRELKRLGFDIVVFTASKQSYADQLLNYLDPSGEIIKPTHRLFREHCIFFRGNYLKNLLVLQRNMARTVIVDNSPSAFALHPENGIPIESWFDDREDTELLKLLDLVEVLAKVQDCRPVLKKMFGYC